jgi:carbon monoxide dehydrogenase subunit G
MEMTGERRISAPREIVWRALNDPAVLQQSIPGCESVERTGDDSFQARVAVKLGPMAARFAGKVQLTNVNAPASYTIGGEGNGGAMGFAKGGADVSLEELSATDTLLRYAVKAQVGGKMAQLGARLIDSTSKQMADQFFDRFTALVSEPTASAAAVPVDAPRPSEVAALPPGTRPTPAPGTAIGDAPAEARLGAATLIGVGLAEHSGINPPGTTVDDIAGRPNIPATPARPVPVNLMALAPTEIFGLPLTFWGGSVIWLILLGVLFLYG